MSLCVMTLEGGISALGSRSVYPLLNGDGGYDHVSRGGRGLVVRLKDEVYAMQVESVMDLALSRHFAARLTGP